jgi:hypothetical protein
MEFIGFIKFFILALAIVAIIFWLALMADNSEIVAAQKEVTDKMLSISKSLPEQLSLGGLIFTYDGLQGIKQSNAIFFEKEIMVKMLWKDMARIEYKLIESSIFLDVIVIHSEFKKKKVICYSFDATYAKLTDLTIVMSL